jgi:hypothetical protein
LLRSDSRFVLDNNLIIAAIKSGWKKSTDLLFTILLSNAAIYVNKELLFEYEKYINKILGLPHLFLLIRKISEAIAKYYNNLIPPAGFWQQPAIGCTRTCR